MVDELKVYRGKDYPVNNYLTISQRTLDEIVDFGDKEYFGYVNSFCATPTDMMIELEERGIDFVKLTDWELFSSYGIYSAFGKDIGDFIFNGFDFSKLAPYKDESGSIILVGDPYYETVAPDGSPYYLPLNSGVDASGNEYKLKVCGLDCANEDEQIVFTESDYSITTQYLRQAHKLKYNKVKPGNKRARKMELMLARRDRQKAQSNKDKSILLDAISTLTNMEGFKYGWLDVWDVKINAFMDAISRVQKIKNANLLLQSGYSGFGIDLNKFSAKEKDKLLNWFGEIE